MTHDPLHAPPCRILLICGSLRAGSTNAAVLQTAESLALPGVIARIDRELEELPHFNPDDDRAPLPPSVARLRAQFDASDAVLFSTPEYAGSLPGAFKNLLDWTVGGGLYEKPVGYIKTTPDDVAKGAHATLRVVLGFVSADVVEAACVQIPVRRDAVGHDGLIADPALRAALAAPLLALAAHVATRGAANAPSPSDRHARRA